MFHDPDLLNLRKAGRAAIVMPGVFAIGQYVLHDENVALFAAFAGFAALVFANFGGPPLRRTGAYLGLLVAGSGLVALGTVVSRSTALAAGLTLVIGFVAVYAGVLGGYWEAATSSLILGFVLAASLTAPSSQLDARVIGWVLGVAAAALAAVVLWPAVERHRVRKAAADVADAAATVLAPGATVLTGTGTGSGTDRGRAAVVALADAHDALHALTGIVYRPVGTSRADRALKLVVLEVERVARLTHALVEQFPHPEGADAELATTAALLLRDAAAALRGTAAPDGAPVADLERRRVEHRSTIEAEARVAAGAGDAAAAVAVIDRSFPLRRLTLLALALHEHAAVAAGTDGRLVAAETPAPEGRHLDGRPIGPDPAVAAAEVHEVLRTHLDLRSVRLRNALRAAVGLAAAMAIAKAANLEHAFWVVLGTLSVLRSNALGTQRTAVQAIAGTVIGFAAASAFMLAVGGDTTCLWIAFPILTFLSAYTSGAVNFVVGQACFTVLIVVLFNFVIPEGWRTGLVRVQDIAIGAGISIVVGFVLWPRGAQGLVQETFVDLLRADADAFGDALDRMEETVDHDPDKVRRDEVQTTARAARGRTLVALEALATERGVEQADRPPWSDLLVLATATIWAAEGIVRDSERVERTGSSAAIRADVVRTGRQVQAELTARASLAAEADDRDGRRLRAPSPSVTKPARDAAERAPELAPDAGAPTRSSPPTWPAARTTATSSPWTSSGPRVDHARGACAPDHSLTRRRPHTPP